MAEWTAQELAYLTENWGKKPCRAIGDHLGRSKGSVVGEARRLGLPALPSVIRPGQPPPQPVPRPRRLKRGAATLPPVAAPPVPAPSPLAGLRLRTCCWPIGEPRTPGFRFCDAPSEPGRPYCAEHARRAYVRRRPLDAAADPPLVAAA
jgi:GcrA cell cycle regulator